MLMKRCFAILLLVVSPSFLKAQESTQRPNIIIIFADDLGWNDVSYHGSPQVPTPNIDALALNGIILNEYYGECMCTPSRAALMTGKYPIRLGLQHGAINSGENAGLPLDEVVLPQYLKKLGYATHIVGKWHLGYPHKEYTPTYRGFDTFFGYFNSVIDYYDYTNYEDTGLPNQPAYYGIDLHNGTRVVRDFRGRYAPHVFTDAATDIIDNHDTSQPLFLYFSQLAVHAGNAYQYSQAPPEIISRFKYILDINRRIHAAVTATLDDAVGSVFKALHRNSMLENSIVVFISDNGGLVAPEEGGFSSNYPLRGQKMTYWDGGFRVPGIIWSPLLKLNRPRFLNGLMHVADWMPTLYRAAGGNPVDIGEIDGIDFWNTLIEDLPSPRTEILHGLDPIDETSSYRWFDLKLVNGTPNGPYNYWYVATERLNDTESMYEWVFQNGSSVRDILQDAGRWIVQDPGLIYDKAQVVCTQPPPAEVCVPSTKPCLFNITADPCEYIDLLDSNPDAVQEIINRLHYYQQQSAPPQSKETDPRADPACHHYSYVSWLDPEHLNDCSDAYD